MDKRELDKITERVISILKDSGVLVSKSGSAESAGHSSEASKDKGDRSPFKMDPMLIPCTITDRAVLLNKSDREKLFGTSGLTVSKKLSAPGREVYEETVKISGPDGDIEGVHVCATSDQKSQVELLSGDDLKLGINAPLRLSGDVECTPGLTIVGSSGSIKLEEGAIIPTRKISLDPPHAAHYGLIEGQVVSVEVSGSRGALLANVAVVIGEGLDSVCFLDLNDAKAMRLSETDTPMVKIVK